MISTTGNVIKHPRCWFGTFGVGAPRTMLLPEITRLRSRLRRSTDRRFAFKARLTRGLDGDPFLHGIEVAQLAEVSIGSLVALCGCESLVVSRHRTSCPPLASRLQPLPVGTAFEREVAGCVRSLAVGQLLGGNLRA